MSVVKFYPKDAANNPDMVLEQAIGVYDDIFIIGYDKDGLLDVRASSGFSKSSIIFALELFKFKIMNGDYEIDKED